MNQSRYVAFAAAVLLSACNPFRSPIKQRPVVEVNTRDANANARWNGTVASPMSLAGAVQMKGSATMTPGSSADKTDVRLNLSNAAPGGVHPWQVHRGQCGADQGVFGPNDAYNPIKIDDQGKAAALTTLPFSMPTEGSYFVSVSASAANSETIVACGNLAPPSR